MPDRDPRTAPVSSIPLAPRIAGLLTAIEREPVPERLLELARQLQKALQATPVEANPEENDGA